MSSTAPFDLPPDVAYTAEYRTLSDGERIFTQCFLPQSERRAALVLSHGLGEHSSVYEPFITYFSARGAAIYAQDHRGFGRSDGHRGHVPHYQRYVEDLRPLVERARAENPQLPLVLVGHSMGGTIALLFTLRHPDLLDRAIFSAPALIVALPIPAWKRLLGHLMSRIYPLYTDVAEMRPEVLTRDPEMHAATLADQIRHGRRTARLFVEMFVKAPREVLNHAQNLRVPFLILHGTADPLVAIQGTKQVYHRAGVAEKAIKIYPELRHEPFREIERLQVFADVEQWLAENGVALHEPATPLPTGS